MKYDPDSWGWHAFSKTFFAKSVSDEHFLRCHPSLIRLLDHADELGLLAEVKDEGGYWQERDWELLAEKIGCQNTPALQKFGATFQSMLWPMRSA